MAYIGKQPLVGNYTVLDSLTATTTDTYALTKNSVAVFPQTPANCIVSLNGVIQAPFDSYTISGSNIVFASALTASDSIDFITVLGDVLNVGTVSDGTIGISKLSATGTKDATTFLRGDNTFASVAGGITEADQWRLNTNFTGDANPIASNLERVDSDGFSLLGTGMTQSSGIFSFPSTGYWFIRFTANYYGNGNTGSYMETTIMTTTDNSTYSNASISYQTMPTSTADVSASAEFLFDVTDISTHKVRFKTTSNITNLRTYGDTNQNMTYMTFIKLGDT